MSLPRRNLSRSSIYELTWICRTPLLYDYSTVLTQWDKENNEDRGFESAKTITQYSTESQWDGSWVLRMLWDHVSVVEWHIRFGMAHALLDDISVVGWCVHREMSY